MGYDILPTLKTNRQAPMAGCKGIVTSLFIHFMGKYEIVLVCICSSRESRKNMNEEVKMKFLKENMHVSGT